MNKIKSNIQSAIHELQAGRMIILVDHPDRENEGDLIFPATTVTPEIVNFMIRHGSGIVCLSLLADHVKKLGLNLMVPPHENTSGRGTPFTISIEAKHGITTGVSAHDRAQTILAAVLGNSTSEDIVTPGHVYPLQANANGVLGRAGHTEGSIDIMKIAGLQPSAVICELMNQDGTMMKGKELSTFAKQNNLFVLSIEDIIHYRRLTENLIQDEVSATLPLENIGDFQITAIKEKITELEHLILIKQKNNAQKPYLVRIHSSCATSEIFGSQRCDCKAQLDYSMNRISKEGGMLIYLNQEGRGIGLFNKIKSYALQEEGMDTVQANIHLDLPVDSRQYYFAANILRDKGINNIQLLTNNPLKIEALRSYGIEHVEQLELPVFCTSHNKNYLLTKIEKLQHSMNKEYLV